jgi:hypothetical protein
MPRTDQQRYDEALKYLKNVDARLASDVDQNIGAFRRLEAGKQISLSHYYGDSYSGSASQHMAVRALLLCQKAYLTPPYIKTVIDIFQFNPDKSKRFWHSKPEIQVIDGIKSYLPTTGATAQDLMNAATRVNSNEPVGHLCEYNRLQPNLGKGNVVCFIAVIRTYLDEDSVTFAVGFLPSSV